MSSFSFELFEELWYKYYQKIFSYFCRQFDESTAEDLCQQTYLNAWRHISLYPHKKIQNGKAWRFSIAKNVKNDYLRYKKQHEMNFTYLSLYENDIPDSQNPDDSILISKALNSLSEEDRALLSMSQYLKSKEIGSVLGISASAARSRIQKAKERLRLALGDYGINE